MITAKQKQAAIAAIAQSNGGVVQPDMVIEAARDPENPLHECFDWDEGRAALEHWRSVARGIIREVQVKFIVNRQRVTTVGYVRNPHATRGEQGYVALSSVERRSETARLIIDAEMQRIESAIGRAREIAGVLGLANDLEKLLADVVLIRAKAKAA